MSLKKNIFYNIILTSTSVIFPLITFPYVTKVLGPENYGNVNFIDAIIQYFLILSTLGIPIYGVREVSKVKNDKAELSKLVFELITIQGIISFFSISFLLLVSNYFSVLSGNTTLLKIGCGILILNLFIWDWLYQGLENYSYITKRSVFSKILIVLFIFIFVKLKDDYKIYYFSFIIGLLTNGLFNITFFLKNHYQSFHSTLNLKKHLKPLFLILAINLSVSIYTLLDTIILGFLSSKINVGYYSLSNRLVKIYWTIISAVGMVLIPRFSILLDNNKFEEVKILMSKSLNVIIVFTLPFALFCICFAKNIVVLISGQEYQESYKSLAILSFLPLIIGICNVFGSQFLFPLNKEKYLLYATLIGLCFSLIINFSLIPLFAEVGAALACLFAEIVVCIFIVIYSRKFIKIVLDLNLFIQIVLCCFLTLPFIYYSSKYLTPIFAILISLISYFGIFLFIQLIVFKNSFIQNLYLSILKK